MKVGQNKIDQGVCVYTGDKSRRARAHARRRINVRKVSGSGQILLFFFVAWATRRKNTEHCKGTGGVACNRRGIYVRRTASESLTKSTGDGKKKGRTLPASPDTSGRRAHKNEYCSLEEV